MFEIFDVDNLFLWSKFTMIVFFFLCIFIRIMGFMAQVSNAPIQMGRHLGILAKIFFLFPFLKRYLILIFMDERI